MTEKTLIRHLERKERWLKVNEKSIRTIKGRRVFVSPEMPDVRFYTYGDGPVFLDDYDNSGSIKLAVSFNVWQRPNLNLELAFSYGEADLVVAPKFLWFSLYLFGIELTGELPFWVNVLTLKQIKKRIAKEEEI